MPLVFNGTTIPENVANALTVNGVDITDVYFNGVQVWHQSLGPTVGWSGSSYSDAYYNNAVLSGINTSGFLYRARDHTVYGAWLTAGVNGLASGRTQAYSELIGNGYGIWTTPNTLQIGLGISQITTTTSAIIWYDKNVKSFSGISSIQRSTGFIHYLEASGGLLRSYSTYNSSTSYGEWISLT